MKINIRHITINSILVSIFLLFALIPWLGYIPIGIFKITLMPALFLISLEILNLTTQINLIICGILYGFLFGLTSLIQAAIYPSVTSFIFINPLFSIVPRILMGTVTGAIAFIIRDIKINNFAKKVFLAFIVTTFNTLFVLIFVYKLGPIIYQNLNLETIFKFFSWIILITNYLPELILTALIYPVIALSLKRIY
ncbi:MAG: ECF transporter S component [Spiroplasma sp.]